ncbi:phytoene desaturase family protein [Gordonia sp. NB41Y]|uniref:phytoene desaturase family protein n=1 Tax=Gordonia sp. NB41Y TaxID=875808 RepID=UPI0006B1E0A4|nr:phytoene desaturase family protein [Gordonia sp. NB41Y]EMP13368.2 phytoene dehydrogenase [Gordonia sp. NB41Y]WLP88784.1 phytoene desaturase family protein [Gordonia sp. NB41Y]
MSDNGSRVAIIGGGVAGLATAALLAEDGHDVEVFEKNPDLGGRTGSWEHDGFRFDTGPSWWLMPEVFEHFFALLGTSVAEQLDLVTLDPGYRVFFDDAPPLTVAAGAEANIAIFDGREAGAGQALSDYLASARDTYRIAVDRFLYTNFDTLRSFTAPEVLAHLPKLAVLLGRSLGAFIADRFGDPGLRQVLGYPAVFLGSSPGRAPAMYHLMSHLDLEDGVRYPAGGFITFIDALERLARRRGVRIHTSATVLSIGTRRQERRGRVRWGRGPRGRVPWGRGETVSGVDVRFADGTYRRVDADIVVGAADLHHLETRLLPRHLQTYPQTWWDRHTSGPGAVLVFLGVRGELPQLAHHSLFFTDDWDTNFDAIFGSPTRIPDPASLYVCRPSATDATVAPDGHENLFVLIPMPADPSLGHGGTDGTGAAAVERIADAAIARIADRAGVPDLAERIVVRRTTGPADFVDDVHSWSGGALGPAHTLRQSAFFRADNISRKVDGLFYAGSSTRPGIGLPMCLISAQLVRKRLRGDTSPGPEVI